MDPSAKGAKLEDCRRRPSFQIRALIRGKCACYLLLLQFTRGKLREFPYSRNMKRLLLFHPVSRFLNRGRIAFHRGGTGFLPQMGSYFVVTFHRSQTILCDRT